MEVGGAAERPPEPAWIGERGQEECKAHVTPVAYISVCQAQRFMVSQ